MSPTWQIRGRTLSLARPLVMGIVNVTPDSFSDGGQFFDPAAAVDRALRIAADGADVLDVGGESTRPGATPVPADEELRRVVPVITALAKQTSLPISIDTMKFAVARAALDAGAHVVNDVAGLRDAGLLELVRDSGAGAVVMHMPGTPQTMQAAADYPEGVVAAVAAYLELRLHECSAQGIAADQVVLDPGIGFGKRGGHNWELIARLGELQRLGRPVCLGVSRKGFIGKATGRDDAADRTAGSLAVACHALAHGSAQVLRVHDVAATRDAVLVFESIKNI